MERSSSTATSLDELLSQVSECNFGGHILWRSGANKNCAFGIKIIKICVLVLELNVFMSLMNFYLFKKKFTALKIGRNCHVPQMLYFPEPFCDSVHLQMFHLIPSKAMTKPYVDGQSVEDANHATGFPFQEPIKWNMPQFVDQQYHLRTTHTKPY